jgi:hypothetical protein
MKSFSLNQSFVIAVLSAITIAMMLVSALLSSQRAEASAPSGLVASIASSSVPLAVGPQAVTTLFNANGGCASRVISTVAQPIMLSFSTSTADALRNKPSGTVGIQQAASTTVVYDSGTYGCPEVTAYGYNASSTITISEFR